MSTPQSGIFALGTAAHAYLEFDVSGGRNGREFVAAISSLREPRTTMGGVNLVAGFRPELWREAVPGDAPPAFEGFNDDVLGIDGFVMPATQHDAVLWLSGSAYDVVFDVARAAITALQGLASVGEETSSWPYRHDLDLTGFIDGTENPTLIEAPEFVLVPEGDPGAGGTLLLLQKWLHEASAWESLPVSEKERVIGRTKPDSVELEDKPADSHVASTDQDRFGKSSGGTCPTERSPSTGRCSSASARRSLRSPRCSRAWPDGPAANATRSRSTRGRSRARTTSFRRRTRSAALRTLRARQSRDRLIARPGG